MRLIPLAAITFLLATAPLFAANTLPGLIPNGNFDTAGKTEQWPVGWPHPKAGVTWQEEDGNHFLRLTSSTPGETLLLYRLVNIPTDARALELSWRWRTTNLKPGKEPWYDARIMMNYKDAAGNKMAGSPDAPYIRSSTAGWQARTMRFAVPTGARSLEFMPTLFQVESGTLDLDDIALKAIAPDATMAGAAPQAVARDLTPEAPNPARWPEELHVVGNRVLNKDGKPVWLQGVNVPSLEWSVSGEQVLRSVEVAVDIWKSNIIRLPVSDDSWFGTGPGQKDGGAAYRATIDNVVNIAANRGAHVLLDLHRYRAPTDAYVRFWKDAAAHFKNNPALLFDILNEPHDISWEVWRSGGTVLDKDQPGGSFKSPGMQGLVDAVRSTGAHNIVVAGGLDWAYDLSGVMKGFALTDNGGNGIIYSTHIYPWKRDWNSHVLVAADKYPILVGEVGCDIKKMSFIPASAQENPYTWAPDVIGFMQKYHLNWTAFSFHPSATPVLITGWDYQPTPFWGAFVKSALLGAQFGLTRMR